VKSAARAHRDAWQASSAENVRRGGSRGNPLPSPGPLGGAAPPVRGRLLAGRRGHTLGPGPRMTAERLEIAFFVSSLVSSYWNGAATYYRGLARALHERGHALTFYEPDAFDRQAHRDIPDPPYARSVVWDPAVPAALDRCLEAARGADLVVKASGVGVHDALLEERVLALRRPGNRVAFWDVDAPATLERLERDPADPFRALVPRYDLVFTYGGGDPVVRGYRALGARSCVPIYNGLDPETHHPVARASRFEADLAFLGNRLPDREARVEEFFLRPAAALPARRFLIGGAGWGDRPMPANVRHLGHVGTGDHNAFNCTPLAVLNVSRDSMARNGFSPATRVFEAAGAGACIVTDQWDGLEAFLEPGTEVLAARDGAQVPEILESLSPARAREIGAAARRRVLAEHTYARRAAAVEAALGLVLAPPAPSGSPRATVASRAPHRRGP
jgi:spore maturation protein CgeB